MICVPSRNAKTVGGTGIKNTCSPQPRHRPLPLGHCRPLSLGPAMTILPSRNAKTVGGTGIKNTRFSRRPLSLGPAMTILPSRNAKTVGGTGIKNTCSPQPRHRPLSLGPAMTILPSRNAKTVGGTGIKNACSPLPVDVTEQAMLNLVPLAGTGRAVTARIAPMPWIVSGIHGGSML